jgi:RNA polymerase sigma-70 factor (ECF subfamily)
VSSAEEAEDITAETFLKIWEYIFNNKRIENLNAFTYQIARNLVIDFYRKKAQQKIVVKENDEELERVVDPSLPVDKRMELASDVEQLEKYLRQLKEEYREIIILRHIDELSISEIAKVLNKTNGNVRVLAHRALTTLKALIEKDDHEQ